MFLCSCNAVSHISESAVLMDNNLPQPKGVDVNICIYCCFVVVNFVYQSVNLFIKNYCSAGVKGWELLLYRF